MAEAVTWLALLGHRPDGAHLAVPVTEHGAPAGWLAAWCHGPRSGAAAWRRPAREAVRCPADVVGKDGDELEVLLTLPVPRRRPLHDDPAVVAATRAAARDGTRLALTVALVADEVHWAGGLSAVTAGHATAWPGWDCLDPWSRLAAARRLRVPAGVLVPRPLPAAPGTQRRGGAPWPSGSFAP